jgi:lysophospholipase L1-like esterase
MTRPRAALAVAALTYAIFATCARADSVVASGSCPGHRWVAVWGSSPSDADGAAGLAGRTVRTVLSPLGPGGRVRISFSNRLGNAPLAITSAFIARTASGAAVQPKSNRRLRFEGARRLEIPAGGSAVSDPVRLTWTQQAKLSVSFHLAAANAGVPITRHLIALQSTYVAFREAGDVAGSSSSRAFTAPGSEVVSDRPLVTSVEVRAPGDHGAVVAFGDSITDGLQGPGQGIDDDARYPDFLAGRLLDSGRELSVVNAGISGNSLFDSLFPQFGAPAPLRLQADVIAQPGAADVIVLMGRNDLGAEPRDADQALRGLVQRLHRAHLNVVLGTLTPAGTTPSTPDAVAAEAHRQMINRWIRHQRVADSVVDFDRAVRDPADHAAFLPRYSSGDELHPSAAGYRVMANTVDLDSLRGPRCAVG